MHPHDTAFDLVRTCVRTGDQADQAQRGDPPPRVARFRVQPTRCPSRLAHQRGMASTRSRPALTSAFTMRASSRSISQCPPL